MLGVIAAMLASLGWGTDAVLARQGLRRVSPALGTFISLCMSLAVCLVLLLVFARDAVATYPPVAFAWFGMIGIINFVIGRQCNFGATQRLGAARGGVSLRVFAARLDPARRGLHRRTIVTATAARRTARVRGRRLRRDRVNTNPRPRPHRTGYFPRARGSGRLWHERGAEPGGPCGIWFAPRGDHDCAGGGYRRNGSGRVAVVAADKGECPSRSPCPAVRDGVRAVVAARLRF